MLCTAVPFFVGATWRLPDTYHSAGFRRGTATLKFYEDRDILGDYHRRESWSNGLGRVQVSWDVPTEMVKPYSSGRDAFPGPGH